MNLSLLAQPYLQFPDAPGGSLYTAQPGTGAGPYQAYPKATYIDSQGVTANMNPIVLDNNGRASVFWDGYYDVALYSSTGVLIFAQQNVSGQFNIQPLSLQWTPASGQVTYINATQFSIPGNQTGVFIPGLAVQATIAGGNIYGIVQTSSVAGSPQVTTVTVSWFSTALNASLSAIATSNTSGGVSGSLPLLPPSTVTATTVLTYSSLFQTIFIGALTASITLTLPAANTVPPGSWIRFRNTYLGIAYTVQFLAVIDGITNPYMLGLDWEVFSDGTSWYARVTPVGTVNIASVTLISAGTATPFTSMKTQIAAAVPAAARSISGYAYNSAGAVGCEIAATSTPHGEQAVGSGAAGDIYGYWEVDFDPAHPQEAYYQMSGSGTVTISLSRYKW